MPHGSHHLYRRFYPLAVTVNSSMIGSTAPPIARLTWRNNQSGYRKFPPVTCFGLFPSRVMIALQSVLVDLSSHPMKHFLLSQLSVNQQDIHRSSLVIGSVVEKMI